ncbi:P2X purinoceptor 2-like [Huso huso]|uniref:P2X purinoceptor n=1 Tax=Huso huso TaxID=61971 RepID=A0ABR0ZFN2_HUSHU|nr:P2X purinoceptor 2-like isoform X1 [Acipenser ruthenus]
MGLKGVVVECFVGFWDYETAKVMVVKNRPLGIIYRSVQFLIVTYFTWYVFIIQKAYQEIETGPESSIYTKMNGVALSGDTVQDMVEYVRPSEGGDVISAILRKEVTHNQRQGVCAEHFSVPGANCTEDSDCTPQEIGMQGNGKRTGLCVPYYNQTFKTCQIKSWCPIEEFAAVREPALKEAINFTVFIKNTVHFPKFRVLRGNTKGKKNLHSCTYNAVTNIYCPVFTLGYIAKQAEENFTELCETGGVIGVFINWKCNLDLDPSECYPQYAFRRLDLRKDLISSGYNYRFGKYYSRNGSEYRSLVKAFGMRIDVIVHGEAGKFSIIPTIINMVAAMTSVGICSFLCDWILLTFIDKNEIYSDMKFDGITSDPSQELATENTTVSQDSTHTDLSDNVQL